jgi:hypothetical protein
MASTSPRFQLFAIIAAVILALAMATSLLMSRPNMLRSLVTRMFGPPQVELAEAHSEAQGKAVFDHTAFDGLLRDHVDAQGLVDYNAFSTRAAELDAYIVALNAALFEELGRDERLALLINAYNAFTLRLILDHFPTESIRDIPDDQRWDAVRWGVAGGTYSLNQIEHELVRPNFREPRIHFALVCAAIGCPPLRSEAYEGVRLEDQLTDQTRFTHESDRWVRYSSGANTLHLTSLYDWYGDDFVQVAGSVIQFVAQQRPDLATDLANGHKPKIRFLSYEWALNAQGAVTDQP